MKKNSFVAYYYVQREVIKAGIKTGNETK